MRKYLPQKSGFDEQLQLFSAVLSHKVEIELSAVLSDCCFSADISGAEYIFEN